MRLLACAEPGGHLVARLGGDEFALLVRDSTGTGQATALAESVLTALQQPFDVAGQRLAVSASIGVVEREAPGSSATGLMQAADTTLYWAKADGKARWTLFDPERNEHRMTRQALSRTLRQAVERGEFVLDYQPLVALDTGELRGVEALVRWEHPHFGRLAPNRFIGLAEEDGSIVQLGRWVLRQSSPAGPCLATGPPGGAVGGERQRRGAADVGLRPGRGRRRDPGGDRAAAAAAAAGTHRVRGDGVGRAAAAGAARAARDGRADRHRRLRHRLLEPGLHEAGCRCPR